MTNVLCLCPNHHVLFDRGVFGFDDAGYVVDYRTGKRLGKLTVRPEHVLDSAHRRSHETMFRG